MKSSESILISVVTVTYNSEFYIRDTIQSILNNEYDNFELIIGDDSSTDNTWSIINEYHDERILKYQNNKNIGEYKNRFKALNFASGEYTIFIDGDDVLHYHGLSTYLKYALKNPEIDLIIQSPERRNVILPVCVSGRDLILNHFSGFDFLSSSFGSNFYRTSFLCENQVPDKIIQGDHYLRLLYCTKKRILFIPASLVWVRETPGSASSKLNFEIMRLDNLLIYSHLLANFKNLGEIEFNFILNKISRQYLSLLLHNLKRFRLHSMIKNLKWFSRFHFYSSESIKKIDFIDFSEFTPQYPFKQ